MSKNKTTTTTTNGATTTTPDATTADRASQLWNLGMNRAGQPAPQYGGDLTAGLSPDQLAAFSLIRNNATTGASQIGAGTDAATAAAGYTPTMVTPGQANFTGVGAAPLVTAGGGVNLANLGTATARDVSASSFPQADLSKYLNPWTDSVVNTSLSDIERARQEAQNVIGARQATSGAFGDSRSGVEASLTNREYANTAASTAANLRSQGFTEAANLIEADANRKLGADQGNQSADVATGVAGLNARTSAMTTNANLGFNASNANASNSLAAMIANANAANNMSQFNTSTDLNAQTANQGAGLTGNAQRLGAASTLGNLGMNAQGQVLNAANAQGAAGAVVQGTNQAADTAQYQDWLRQQGWTDAQIAQMTSIFSTMPRGSTSTTDSTQKQVTPGSLIPDLLGAAIPFIPGVGAVGKAIGGALSSK